MHTCGCEAWHDSVSGLSKRNSKRNSERFSGSLSVWVWGVARLSLGRWVSGMRVISGEGYAFVHIRAGTHSPLENSGVAVSKARSPPASTGLTSLVDDISVGLSPM